MKSILYYLDPRTELNDKMFRYATLRSYLLPEIQGLKKADPSLEVKIILSKNIFTQAIKNGLKFDDVECFIVDEDFFESRLSQDNCSTSISLYHNTLNEKDNNVIKGIIRESIPESYYPDLIISYESPAPFLKEMYPDALLLNSMFGIFSRAPYPAYGLLDPCGLYEYSYQYKYAERIRQEKISSDERDVINLLRKQTTESLATHHPLKKYISSLYERFDRLIVLACQVDNYFSYNGCTQYASQFEMVKDVLAHTSDKIGVIVTEHGYKRQINDEQLKYLSDNFSGFIYFSEKDMPTPTQFILPYIDGALSVSSSIGYQAALWQIPYFGLGCSQVDIFSSHNSIQDFFRDVNIGEKYDRDNIIYTLLSKIHLSHKNDLFDGDKYIIILRRLFSKFKAKCYEYDYFSDKKDIEDIRKDIVSGNRDWLLKKTLVECDITPDVDHLRVAMSHARAVSYDLFDTLVERDFVEPHELFNLIEPRIRKVLKNKNFPFYYIRRQAEIDLRRESRGEFEITLDEIYNRFPRYFDLSVPELNIIKNIEIEAEVELVHPKKEMIREFYFSQIICESVSIIADIYLSRDVIERILEKVNIRGYNKLWVSAETKTRKHNGTIYPDYLNYIKKYHSILPAQALHIGDNNQADGEMAKKNGMKSYVFPKAIDNYKKSRIADVMRSSLNNLGGSSSVINGMFANKYHAGHWFKINKESVFNADEYNYGYMAIGPLVTGFTQWLYRRVRRLGINKVYFLSRDGWILKQAFDFYYPGNLSDIKTEYLYSSRRTAMVSSIRTIEDIIEVASQNFNARRLSDFLSSRFGLNIDGIDQTYLNKYNFKKDSMVSPYFEFGKLISFLTDIQYLIFANAEEERESYKDYLNDIGFINDCLNENTAVVDIGYSGSMQYYLKKVIQCDSLHGFYFLTHHHSRDYFDNDHFEGFLQSLDDHKIAYRHGLNDHVFIFEAALSSPEGSLIKMQGKGNNRKMVFLEAEEEVIRRKALLRTHQGVLDFVTDIKIRFGSYFNYIEFSSILSSQIILNFANNPNGKDAGMFSSHEVENVFGGGSVCLISPVLDSYKDAKGSIDPKIIEELLKCSKWKKGASAYYNYVMGNNSGTEINNVSVAGPATVASKKPTYAHPIKTSKQRKFSKFIKDPYSFFNDSKKSYLKILRVFFKDKKRFN